MEAVQKQRVDEIVYEKLLANIRDGIWTGGQKISSEPELCEILGVSRVTVRSAIQRLRAVGLVEVKHGKGTYVVKPDEIYGMSDFNPVLDLTEKDFNEINDLREAIETKSVQLIMEQGDHANLEAIESAYFAMKDALRARDYEKYSKQDYLFHLSIIIATNNDIFIQIINIFRNQYYKYFRELNKFMFEDSETGAALLMKTEGASDSHTILYNYLTRKDVIEAKQLMQTFISGNKKRFSTYLREGRTGG